MGTSRTEQAMLGSVHWGGGGLYICSLISRSQLSVKSVKSCSGDKALWRLEEDSGLSVSVPLGLIRPRLLQSNCIFVNSKFLFTLILRVLLRPLGQGDEGRGTS